MAELMRWLSSEGPATVLHLKEAPTRQLLLVAGPTSALRLKEAPTSALLLKEALTSPLLLKEAPILMQLWALVLAQELPLERAHPPEFLAPMGHPTSAVPRKVGQTWALRLQVLIRLPL